MIQQGSQGIRGPASATAGSTIQIEVASNDCSVQVSLGGSETWHFDIGPDKTAQVTVPPAPPGTILVVSVGHGISTRLLLVEIVALAT